MEKTVFSLPSLLWQTFNILVLLAVFAFLGWRVLKVIQRRLAVKRRRKP